MCCSKTDQPQSKCIVTLDYKFTLTYEFMNIFRLSYELGLHG